MENRRNSYRNYSSEGFQDPEQADTVATMIYFAADDGRTGTELWKSNGTAAGTVMVRDIRSGTTGTRDGRTQQYAHDLHRELGSQISSVGQWRHAWGNDTPESAPHAHHGIDPTINNNVMYD